MKPEKSGLLKPEEGEKLLGDILGNVESKSLCQSADDFMLLFPIRDRFRASCALGLLLCGEGTGEQRTWGRSSISPGAKTVVEGFLIC